MKLNKIMGIALAAALMAVPVFAEESALTFAVQTDLVCNFTHDATSPITGVGMPAGRIIPKVNYKIATPLGESWLVSGACVDLSAYAEITPVTAKPGVSVTFTPVPFLVFSAGGELGSGWSLMGLQGSSIITGVSGVDSEGKPVYDYKTSLYYKAFAQGTFQFDVGAVVPGDWTHVLMQYTYQFYLQNMIGAKLGDQSFGNIWVWQGGAPNVGAPCEYQCAILAYGIPNPVFYRVGVMYERDGIYGYAKDNSIAPLACFAFGSHLNLNTALYIKKDKGTTQWYFQRAGFSFTYTF